MMCAAISDHTDAVHELAAPLAHLALWDSLVRTVACSRQKTRAW